MTATLLAKQEAHILHQDIIVCECGNKIYTALSNQTQELLYEDSFNNELEDKEEFQCSQCDIKYELTVTVRKTVQFEYSTLEKLHKFVVNTEGYEFDTLSLADLTVGDQVALDDGLYYYSKYEYRVEDGLIESIFNCVVDNSQLSMEALLFQTN